MMHIATDFKKNVLHNEGPHGLRSVKKDGSCHCSNCTRAATNGCDKKRFVMETKSNIGEITVIPLLLPCILGC
jgi:hypothetical protein